MESHNENDVHPEGDSNANDIAPPEEGHFEAIQVLETMRHLIVEILSFKAENEQPKKAQDRQQEINQILLQSLYERSNEKDQQAKENGDRGVDENAERKDSSSNALKYLKTK